MEQLTHYLATQGISQSDFAKSIGTSRGYVHDLMHGRRAPGRALAVTIERKTKGAVRVIDWSPARTRTKECAE